MLSSISDRSLRFNGTEGKVDQMVPGLPLHGFDSASCLMDPKDGQAVHYLALLGASLALAFTASVDKWPSDIGNMDVCVLTIRTEKLQAHCAKV